MLATQYSATRRRSSGVRAESGERDGRGKGVRFRKSEFERYCDGHLYSYRFSNFPFSDMRRKRALQ
jgi:hypothetical protein